MRVGTNKRAAFILGLTAAIAGVAITAAQGARAGQIYEGETGRPAVLINRPVCGTDSFSEDVFECRGEWQQSKGPLFRPPQP